MLHYLNLSLELGVLSLKSEADYRRAARIAKFFGANKPDAQIFHKNRGFKARKADSGAQDFLTQDSGYLSQKRKAIPPSKIPTNSPIIIPPEAFIVGAVTTDIASKAMSPSLSITSDRAFFKSRYLLMSL